MNIIEFNFFVDVLYLKDYKFFIELEPGSLMFNEKKQVLITVISVINSSSPSTLKKIAFIDVDGQIKHNSVFAWK